MSHSCTPNIQKFKPRMYSYSYVSPGEETYRSLGFTTKTHLLVRCDKARVRTYDGEEMPFPDPWGMSGGGVWRLTDLTRLTRDTFRPSIVAIAIEYHKSHQVLVGTKIAFVLEAVRKKYPELDKYVPRCAILKLNVRPE